MKNSEDNDLELALEEAVNGLLIDARRKSYSYEATMAAFDRLLNAFLARISGQEAAHDLSTMIRSKVQQKRLSSITRGFVDAPDGAAETQYQQMLSIGFNGVREEVTTKGAMASYLAKRGQITRALEILDSANQALTTPPSGYVQMYESLADYLLKVRRTVNE